ncbi:MAG: hypothetical protein GY909_05770 [Oligoflexia bacterium]|nr:hypothetical protein [Oligoflexia bacterium]
MKNFTIIIMLLVGGAHLSLQVLKLLPTNPLTNYYNGFVAKYDLGFIPQKWLLFAPEPPKFSHRFHYRCGINQKEWSYWNDPVEENLQTHHRNRLSPAQYKVRFFKDSIRVLNNAHSNIGKGLNCPKTKNQECYKESIKKLIDTKPYEAMAFIVTDLCKEKYGEGINLIQFRSLTIHPVSYSKRNDPNAKTNVNSRLYPVTKTMSL